MGSSHVVTGEIVFPGEAPAKVPTVYVRVEDVSHSDSPAQTIAEYNPVSFIVEGVRDPVISTLTGEDAWKAFASIAGIAALSLGLSGLALRHRLRTGG